MSDIASKKVTKGGFGQPAHFRQISRQSPLNLKKKKMKCEQKNLYTKLIKNREKMKFLLHKRAPDKNFTKVHRKINNKIFIFSFIFVMNVFIPTLLSLIKRKQTKHIHTKKHRK
jgi:hypothetical protein